MSARTKTQGLALIAYVIGLTVIVTSCGSREDEGREPAAKLAMPEPQPVRVDGIRNAKQIGADLLFGGQPTEAALRALADKGYKTVVNTRGEGETEWNERALVESLGMKYVTIPMAYPIEAIPDDWVSAFGDLLENADRPMLIHCSSGNRVGGLYGVWLAEERDVRKLDALKLAEEAGMTRLRPVVERRLGPLH